MTEEKEKAVGIEKILGSEVKGKEVPCGKCKASLTKQMS